MNYPNHNDLLWTLNFIHIS